MGFVADRLALIKTFHRTRHRKGRFDPPRVWLVDRTKSLFTSAACPVAEEAAES